MSQKSHAVNVRVILPDGLDPSAARMLDDSVLHQRLDGSQMLAAIDTMPAHLSEATKLASQVDWLSYKPTTPAGVCVCGMGGSAIGGDLVRSYWEPESPVPMTVVRSDRLPECINRFYMVIASSYSGNTAETLASVEIARERHCNILAITSGGRLAELAKQYRWPTIIVPRGLMPRAALGYSFGPVMLALMRWGIVPNRETNLAEAIERLREAQSQYGLAVSATENPAKQAAAALQDRLVCVYGTAGETDVVALRLKCQLCENAKVAAFANVLPELNHNEIVGMDSTPHIDRLAAVTVETGEESAVGRKRLDWVAERLSGRGIPVVRLRAESGDRLTRLLSLVHIGDYISYHLAIISGQDPTPIPTIDALKADLA